MTKEEIELELKNYEGKLYFISILDEFVWDRRAKCIVGYDTPISRDNELEVCKTIPVDLTSTNLKDFLEKNEIEEDDLVFCINKEFIPNKDGNWILIYVIKNIKKKEIQFKRKPKKED